jgi:DnaJ-class molecular chaperone
MPLQDTKNSDSVKTEICPVCCGSGRVESVAVTLICPDCDGQGLVEDTHPGLVENFSKRRSERLT